MDTLLMIAVVVIALAIAAQAGVLIAMYVMSRNLKKDVDGLIADSRRLVPPLESVATSLKTFSSDLAVSGKSLRNQVDRLEATRSEVSEILVHELDELRDRVNGTVEDVRETVLSPVHQWSAIARGIATGLGTFIFGRKPRTEDEQEPAA